ncbi:hypothetical protein [Lactococcus kimchii]|uniref:hypothetical protein n=1 Tax=Lactococcus sp. S-13 TaxID=2507158 RepID=UPI001023D06B|nr:hypothetical protein [Lactococcus sp. S-13]RZI49641.1 hypothetical protein EQJ87_09505 [Lactococcus sp. S-13]
MPLKGKLLLRTGAYRDYFIDTETYQVYSTPHDNKEDIEAAKKTKFIKFLPYFSGLSAGVIAMVAKYLIFSNSKMINFLILIFLYLLSIPFGVYAYRYGGQRIMKINSSREFEHEEMNDSELKNLYSLARNESRTMKKFLIGSALLIFLLSIIIILHTSLLLMVLLMSVLAMFLMFITGVKRIRMIDFILKEIEGKG